MDNKMKLYVLDLGYIECDGLMRVANCSIGTLSYPNPTNLRVKMPCYAVLIDHPDRGWVLFDTGNHPDAAKGYFSDFLNDFTPYIFTEDQRLVNQLAKLGLTPDDIGTVILSHGHCDHTGGLKLFKNAEIIWARADFDAAMEALYANPGAPENGAYVRADLTDLPAKAVRFVDEDGELMAGVEGILLPGHTPAVLGLVVHLEGGTIILPSDTIYCTQNFGDPEKGIPPMLSGNVYDSLGMRKSVEKVRKLMKKYNATVFFSHDDEMFKTLKLSPEYYW